MAGGFGLNNSQSTGGNVVEQSAAVLYVKELLRKRNEKKERKLKMSE